MKFCLPALLWLSVLFPLSDGAECSQKPRIAEAYKGAVEIVGWNSSKISNAKLSSDLNVLDVIELAAKFKADYEQYAKDSEEKCDVNLYQIYLNGFGIENWTKLPPKYQQVLEDFIDNAVQALWKLGPDYCEQVTGIYELLVEKAKPFLGIKFCDYPNVAQMLGKKIKEFIPKFETIDKRRCSRLFQFGGIRSPIYDIWEDETWNSVPKTQLDQLKHFMEFADQTDVKLNNLLGGYTPKFENESEEIEEYAN